MPKTVEIAVFNIARTQVDRSAVRRWLDFLDVHDFSIPDDGAISDPALLVALAGKRCYMSYDTSKNPNLTKIRNDYATYLDNVLRSGHGSVVEHSVYTFAIENVSRIFTAEMNRHRAGWAISEGSLRFIRFGENIPYWEPDSIRGPEVEPDDMIYQAFIEQGPQGLLSDLQHARPGAPIKQLDFKKQLTRLIFRAAFQQQQDWYRAMEAIWAEELAPESKFAAKKQITSMMRRIIGLGVATGGVWSGNLRALRHVITMRAAPEAEEEILRVFSEVARYMVAAEPLLFGDFTQTDDGFWVPRYRKV